MGILKNKILGIESRKKERMPICVLVEEPGRNQEYFDKTLDLSEEGMFVETESPKDKGQEVTLRFALPGNPVVTVSGEVTRVSKKKPSLFRSPIQPGMGIRFTKLDEQSQQIISKFVKLDY